jgi:transcription elongation GreA/GreB family factor
MCWETDYRFFAEQQRLREKQAKQERRTELIDQLLKDAQQTGEEIPQAKENVPAK